MSEPEHTPGPWSAKDFKTGDFHIQSRKCTVAIVKEIGVEPSQRVPNALLIAKAPDLLQTAITLSAKLRDMAKYAPTETTRKAVLEMCDEADNLVNR